MTTIEEIVEVFSTIPPADGNRWAVATLAVDRLYLSRSEQATFAVFLEGARDSFGVLPSWSGVAHSDSVTVLPSGRTIAALRISCQDPTHGNRVIAHIAYELARRIASSPEISNGELVAEISWILPLLGDQEAVLSAERQYGLFGELMLIRRLLGAAVRLGIPGREALHRWKGSATSKRDFAARGIAIEVKTTSHVSRLHHFASIEQLDPQFPGEEVFLFSVGTRLDASAAKKLPDYVAEIETGLIFANGHRDEEAVALFQEQLRSYGYRMEFEPLYRSAPGFRPPHLIPTLYREENLDRVRHTSFKEDSLPSMVRAVGYSLEVQGPGLSPGDAEALLERFLQSPRLEIGP